MKTAGAGRVMHRDMARDYPVAVGGDGAELVDAAGRRYLDAASGVFVALLGHSASRVARRIADQVLRLGYAYTGDFTTRPEQDFAARLIDLAPPGMARVWIASSGSAANEAALKLARQYHLLRGAPGKTAVVARRHSYHGSTMGALSMTGSLPRRAPYAPYLVDFPHVDPPYCYRCPLGLVPETCGVACADLFEAEILRRGADRVAAVIVEPVAGGPLGALVSPPGYLRRLRAICDAHDVLMIADEVVSAPARTGDWFGVNQSGVTPDIMTLGKGLGAGFVPIGAMVVRDRVVEAFGSRGASFLHGESFAGHVLLATAGLAVLDEIAAEGLVDRAARSGAMLGAALAPLADHPLVGEVRGRGLIHGLELVADKATRAPFDRRLAVAERVAAHAREAGLLLLAGNAAADGVNGDTIVVAPPLVIRDDLIGALASGLGEALDHALAEIRTDSRNG